MGCIHLAFPHLKRVESIRYGYLGLPMTCRCPFLHPASHLPLGRRPEHPLRPIPARSYKTDGHASLLLAMNPAVRHMAIRRRHRTRLISATLGLLIPRISSLASSTGRILAETFRHPSHVHLLLTKIHASGTAAVNRQHCHNWAVKYYEPVSRVIFLSTRRPRADTTLPSAGPNYLLSTS